MWPFSRRSAPPTETKAIAGTPAQGFLPTLGAIPSAAGVLISQATALTDPTVYACVTIRSQDVARCSPYLYRLKPDGSEEIVTDHPVAKLLKRPNRQQTWFEFAEQMHAGYLLRGNAYAVIIRDARGRPTELFPVNPDAVQVLEASDGSILYSVNRVGLFQIAMLRNFPVSIHEEDIFHLRDMAFNITAGAGRLTFARDSIGLSMALLQQVARWMQNSARPSVLLKTAKQLTEPVVARLKKSWNEMFGGLQNVGATAVLEEGLEPVILSLTAADLQHLEQRRFSVLEICRYFRMPPHKVAHVEDMSKLNLPQLDQDYVNSTIMPDLDRWEQKLAAVFDLDEEGLTVRFDESRLLRADIATRVNVGRLMVLSGLGSANEWRKEERLAPVKGGDEVRAPLNTAPLGSDLTGVAPDGAGRPPGSGNKEPIEQ